MKIKNIPKFESEVEEAKFWDSHSPLDYQKEFIDIEEPLKFSPVLLRKFAKKKEEKKRLLTLRIEGHQVDLAKVIAKLKGLGYQTQMRMWIIEGIRKELIEHPEIKKLFSVK